MKKIFTLIAIATLGIGAYAVENIETDEYKFDLRLLDESGQAMDQVNVILSGVFPENCDVFQATLELPEGVTVVPDPDTEELAVIDDDMLAGLGVTAKNVNARLSNGTSMNSAGNLFLNIDHTLSARSKAETAVFPAGEKDVLRVVLDCSGMADKTNYATLLQGGNNTIFSCGFVDDKIYVPASEVKLKLYKKDGIVSQIEVINANDVPAAQKGIYNMMGVKVNRAEPGQMYIIDGKKVIPTTVIER